MGEAAGTWPPLRVRVSQRKGWQGIRLRKQEASTGLQGAEWGALASCSDPPLASPCPLTRLRGGAGSLPSAL